MLAHNDLHCFVVNSWELEIINCTLQLRVVVTSETAVSYISIVVEIAFRNISCKFVMYVAFLLDVIRSDGAKIANQLNHVWAS